MKTTSHSTIIGKLGAGAATLAGITGAHATIVQITLTGNEITETTNTLEADLTGDGVDDITFANSQNTAQMVSSNTVNSSRFSASVQTNGGAFAFAYYWKNSVSSSDLLSISGTVTNDKLIAISFNDPDYGGAVNAWLDVHAERHSPSSVATVILQRVIWDDAQPATRPTLLSVSATAPAYAEATKVPEPSGLALLALGAGGLLLRRKRQA